MNKFHLMNAAHGRRTKRRLGRKMLSGTAAALLVTVILTGCSTTSANAQADTSAAEAIETADTSNTTIASNTADTSNTAEVTAADTTAETTQENTGDFSFQDLVGHEFFFSSGHGGWNTDLTINADGSFSGVFHDTDMGETGDNYPEGTTEICSFKGQFTEPEKIDEYTYSFKIKEMTYDNEVGTEEILDNTKYCYTTAYGLDDAEELRIYLPGTPSDKLSQEALNWLEDSSCFDGPELTDYALVAFPSQNAFMG